jgi:plastocyanin
VIVEKTDVLTVFNPKKLEIQLNKDVSFTVLNKDTVAHNVTIPAFTVDMDVQPGQVITVKIPAVSSAPRDGFFSFYCKYHQTVGEAGRITVAK